MSVRAYAQQPCLLSPNTTGTAHTSKGLPAAQPQASCCNPAGASAAVLKASSSDRPPEREQLSEAASLSQPPLKAPQARWDKIETKPYLAPCLSASLAVVTPLVMSAYVHPLHACTSSQQDLQNTWLPHTFLPFQPAGLICRCCGASAQHRHAHPACTSCLHLSARTPDLHHVWLPHISLHQQRISAPGRHLRPDNATPQRLPHFQHVWLPHNLLHAQLLLVRLLRAGHAGLLRWEAWQAPCQGPWELLGLQGLPGRGAARGVPQWRP